MLGGASAQANPPLWPPSVTIFSPDMNMTMVQEQVDLAWMTNGKQGKGSPFGQFSTSHFAFLFKPGSYSVDVPIGYYTQVAGLGVSPDDVLFDGPRGPHVPCDYDPQRPGALDSFWRSAENFKRSGDMLWAVSQASPLRRVHITGDLALGEHTCWSSGGYLSNSVVKGSVDGGTQQQWFARSAEVGSWRVGGWSTVVVGMDGPKQHPEQCDLRTTTCGTSPYGPQQTVVVDEVPVVAEKPFVSVDAADTSKFSLNVPGVRLNSSGADWSAGISIPFEQVYVTWPGDSASLINIRLSLGLHVVVTPGIYALDEPLRLSNPNQILLCLGIATLQSSNGNAVVSVLPGADGARVAGCLLEAGNVSTEALLQWGDETSEGTSSNPGFLQDIFVRVGGPTNTASAETMVRINASYVVGDHLWLWRADHYDSGNSMAPIEDSITMLGELGCDHGLVVTGHNVTIYGLAVEHTLKDQVVWSGEGGAVYFYQCECPYDVTSEWADKGYVAYRVDEGVRSHIAYGIGVYTYFRDHEVWMETAIRTPAVVQGSIVQPFLTFLNGHGGIRSTINGVGPGVGEAGSFELQFFNNDCSWECRPATMHRSWWIIFVGIVIFVLAVLVILALLRYLGVCNACCRRSAKCDESESESANDTAED
mmetsp:Transcript_115621/g.367541  ORF Transcript_115621/g.367541 Transcript_115621/m.367541 type:complete len:648 (+) Transcript_115621:98-2041(+)